MAVRIVITPGDSMWWLLRPEFLAYVDRVMVDPADYSRVESEKSDSGYHAAVWRRLSVLGDNGVLDLSPVEIDLVASNLEAERRLERILADQDLAEVFTADMVFAYKYWLEFNQQRLETLPVVDAYAQCVREHLPVWAADLDLLASRGRQAFREQPKILEQTARSIVSRVGCLWEINRRYCGAAFASLRQFQPFIKYVECPQSFSLEGRLDVSGAECKDLASARTINLPVEPEIDFLSHRLSKLDYWERLSAIRGDHAGARARLSVLLETSGEVLAGLRAGRCDARAIEAYARLDREMTDYGSEVRGKSPYLREAFYGLCLVPTLALARILAGSSPEGERGPAMRSGERGPGDDRSAGLSGYYAIEESLLDLTRIECPRRARVWRKAGSRKRYTFWRAADY